MKLINKNKIFKKESREIETPIIVQRKNKINFKIIKTNNIQIINNKAFLMQCAKNNLYEIADVKNAQVSIKIKNLKDLKESKENPMYINSEIKNAIKTGMEFLEDRENTQQVRSLTPVIVKKYKNIRNQVLQNEKSSNYIKYI